VATFFSSYIFNQNSIVYGDGNSAIPLYLIYYKYQYYKKKKFFYVKKIAYSSWSLFYIHIEKQKKKKTVYDVSVGRGRYT